MLQSRSTLAACLAVALMLASASAQLPEIYYFQFNEGSGTMPADLAIPGLGGTATLNGDGGYERLTSRIGSACLAPGPGLLDRVQTNAMFSVAGGDWTVEFWIYNRRAVTDPTPNAVCGDAAAGAWKIHRGGTAAMGDLIWEHQGSPAVSFVGADVQNAWVHVALVHDSVGLTLTPYVNSLPGTAVPTGAPITFTSTSQAGLAIGGNSSDPAWDGFIDEFRFWSQARTATDIALNNFLELNAPIDDATTLGIVSPDDSMLGCNTFSANESVTVVIRNTGLNTLPPGSSVPVTYSINGGAAIIESAPVPNAINSNDSFSYTFNATADLSTPGMYSILALVALPGDSDPTNDSVTTTVASGGSARITQFPYSEDFESLPNPVNPNTDPPFGWEQDQSDATGTGAFPDWVFTNTQTPPPTGPLADNTTGQSGVGFYAYCSDLGNHPEVNLRTPCLDLGALTGPALSFFYWSENVGAPTAENFLHIDVLPLPPAAPVLDVTPPIGSVGGAWNFQSVDLSAFAGQVIQIRFRGESDGGSLTHDLAIDDVLVFEAAATNGQSPQVGAGVFDINDSVNGIGAPVSSAAAGPYFATAQIGGQSRLVFEGEPNQPVIVLFGPLNPGLFSLPGAGSLDVGTGVDPTSGFPLGVDVLVNGAIPSGLNLFFNTGPTGSGFASFPVPNLPLGVLSVFQAMILNSASPVNFVFTNAVELTITP